MGESFGRYTIGRDSELMPLIDSCNIACGFHGGDPLVIERTISMAINHDVKIGAHPSYPDLQGFGRRAMDIAPGELEAIVRYQISALFTLVRSFGSSLHHVKPHGALYNRAFFDKESARAICKAILSIDHELVLYAPWNSSLAEEGLAQGLTVHYEAFLDRRYNEDGTLVNRKSPDAVITDKQASFEQLEAIVAGKVKTITGKTLPLRADTFCIHGDNPSALDILMYVRQSLISG